MVNTGVADFLGDVTIPIYTFVGKGEVDEWYKVLPRENKKDVVSGDIHMAVTLEVRYFGVTVLCCGDDPPRLFFNILYYATRSSVALEHSNAPDADTTAVEG